MANSKKASVKVQAAPAVVQSPTKVVNGQAQPMVITSVKSGVALRGARAAWYAVLQQHAGRPASEFLAFCTAQPPSLPKSGVAEKATGWLRYFVRTGIATLG